MKKLGLLPVSCSGENTLLGRRHDLLLLPQPVGEPRAVVLLADTEAGIAIAPAGEGGGQAHPASGAPVAELWCQKAAADVEWWLVPRSPELLVNGITPLPLARLDGGDLLALGPRWWYVTSEWAPEAVDAPAELAERPCPVCGAALSFAKVCQCACGRYYHLEQPGAADDGEVLNCYLSAPCNLCGREPSLEPRLVPEPPEQWT
jgi:hypothetical protein